MPKIHALRVCPIFHTKAFSAKYVLDIIKNEKIVMNECLNFDDANNLNVKLGK